MRENTDVLLVEDLPTDAELCKREVEKVLGSCEFRCVETREAYREALAERTPHIILSDFKLPSFDGLSALEIAKTEAPEVPFVIVTGSQNEDTAVDCMKAGAWNYVIKEHIGRLGPAVVSALKQQELRRERQKIEEILEEERELLREIAANLPSAYLSIVCEDFTIGFTSGQGFKKRNLDPKRYIGLTLEEVFGDKAAFVRERYQKAFQGEETTFELTFDEEHQLYRAVPLHDKDHRVNRILVVVEDITERKRLQSQIAQSDRLASMGMLAAGVAHEINNPLAYVLFNLESLVEDLPTIKSSMARFVEAVERRTGSRATDRLLRESGYRSAAAQCDQLLSFARDALGATERIKEIAKGLSTFSRVEQTDDRNVDLNYAVNCAVNMAWNEIKYRARFKKDLSEIPKVLASDVRLSQVFLNLLINAAQSMEEGDVVNNEICVRTWADGDDVWAEVSDTGAGIPPEHLGELFEPFFTTKVVGVGSGLGLSICQSIVTGYGGELTVESEVGRGSRFFIRLPRSTQVPSSTDSTTSQEPLSEMSGRRGRILLVDDEDGVRNAILHILESQHDIVAAHSGQEAQSLLNIDPAFDLVLCDLMMPNMSGMELYEWLTVEKPNLASQVIFMTGGSFTPKARQFLNETENLCVEKPFRMSEIRRIIAERLATRRSEQAGDIRDTN